MIPSGLNTCTLERQRELSGFKVFLTKTTIILFDIDKKKQILKKLIEASSFESFLQKKFVGQKRFSLEGGESLIPALDSIFENAALKRC